HQKRHAQHGRSPPPCSSASQLLLRGLTSRARASSATAPRLPDADRRPQTERSNASLPVPRDKERLHMPGSSTTPGHMSARAVAPIRVAFHTCDSVGPRDILFRGSMAGLCTPLPTLRLYLHRNLRTARGRCGSLLLHRGGLSPPTPRRFHRRTT